MQGNRDAASDGQAEFIWQFIAWVLIWLAVFYGFAFTFSKWTRCLPSSTKAHENDRYWCARNLVGIVHALLISGITVPAVIWLASTHSRTLQFASTRHLALCTPDEMLPDLPWSTVLMLQAVALAGLAFTAFTVADVIISLVHRLATVDFIVHHIAFICAGLIIRGNCMLPYNASILLAMEASTPCLNLLTMLRNRGPRFQTTVKINGVFFSAFYVLFRLVLNSYGTAFLMLEHDSGIPAYIPRWQVWFLLVAVVAGAAVQFFWFPSIVRTFCAGLGLTDWFGQEHEDRQNEVRRPSQSLSTAGDDCEDQELLTMKAITATT